MTLATTPPNQAGFYWFRYDDLSSHVHFKVLLQVIQLIPLEQVPAGLWRGPIRDLTETPA
jgi:hypothetical protein